MKKLTRGLLSLALALCVLLATAACGADKAPTDSQEQVAKVNDTVITEGQLDKFSTLLYYIWGYDPSEMSTEEKQYFLDSMVECEAIRQYYEAQGEDIYDDEYDSGKSSFVSSARESEADFLEENNLTDEDLIYYYRSAYLSQKFYESIQDEHSEEEMTAAAQQYYEDNKESYADEESESGYKAFEDVQEEINYALYNQYYTEKIEAIRKDMTIEETTLE